MLTVIDTHSQLSDATFFDATYAATAIRGSHVSVTRMHSHVHSRGGDANYLVIFISFLQLTRTSLSFETHAISC